MDKLNPQQRSENMSRIRGKNTKPEKRVRSLLHRLGFRFRLHSRKLPGRPDIVLPRYRTVVFTHGCFWHRHENCPDATLPKSNAEFWFTKLEGNRLRDEKVRAQLEALGQNVVIVWECELKDPKILTKKLMKIRSER